MDSFSGKEKYTGDIQPGSFLGVKLRYRDDEDCLYTDCSSLGPQPFTRLHPYLWRFMKEESEELLSDQDFDEPVENKFYWEVTKYICCRECFTEEQKFILGHAGQLKKPLNVVLPYAPLDRVKVVDMCEDPFLLKGLAMLKEDPAVFRKWIKWKEE